MTDRVTIDAAALDALLETYNRSDRPGIAVGVALHGVPRYRRGFGLANVELPVALSPSMRIRIGSITKHFCCLAIMLLAEDGKLSPDDSIRRHIPELAEWAEGVTLAQLMSHTSGTRCSLELFSLAGEIMSKPLANSEQLALLTKLRSANFAPGTDWSYSNGGYVLLTETVKRASGTPFAEFLKARILDPVGMADSLARPLDTDLLPNSATLHMPNAAGGYDRGIFGPEIGGEGNMVSTVDDMLRWMAHMDAPVVGSAESWRAMRTPVILRNGRSTGYGYGLAASDYRGVRTLHHSGTVVGGASQMIKLVDHGLDIVVLANTGAINPVKIAEQIIDACIVDLAPAAENVPGPFPIGDHYARDTGQYARLVTKDDAPGLDYGVVIPLRRDADGSAWVQTNLTIGLTLTPHDDGVDWTEFSGPHHMLPVRAPATPELPAIVGRYRCGEAGIDAEVTGGDSPQFRISGAHGENRMALDPCAPGAWRLCAPGSNALLGLLERDGDAVMMSSARIKRLRFTPVPATA